MNKTRISQLTAALVVFVGSSCQEISTSPATPDAPDFSLLSGNGIGAIVAPNCFAAKGTVIGTIVPVSATDWWFTEAEAVSSNCRTQPGGKHSETVAVRVLDDIPLPDRAQNGSLSDENGDPIVINLTFPDGFVFPPDGEPDVLEGIVLAFFFDSAPFDETIDCHFAMTPGGMFTTVCTFEAPA
jgi:hypothetical protein